MTERTMEEICDNYFSSISPIACKIIEEKRKCIEKNKRNWERLTQDEKDSLLDEWFIDPDLKIRYEIRLQGMLLGTEETVPASFPRLKVQSGTKTVHYTEHEDGSQSKGTCQQDLPMISPGSMTASSNKVNDKDYPEIRYSLNVDSTEESQLITNSTKSKNKETWKANENSEKPDKTRISRKDSKKEENAKEKECAHMREKENEECVRDKDVMPVVIQQPKPAQSPLAEMSMALNDKNGKGPRRDKSDKTKSPKTQRSRNSEKAPTKRDGKSKEKSPDMEGLLVGMSPRSERSLDGINLARAREVEAEPASPLPSAASNSDSRDYGETAGGDGTSFDFLLQW